MTRLRLALVGVGCFLGGVAFVVACGDGGGMVDAGHRADAAGCDMCEPPITKQRVYQVRDIDSGSTGSNALVSTAECKNSEDILLSGGCYLHTAEANSLTENDGNKHPLLGFGPEPPVGSLPGFPARYTCMYENDENFPGLVVVATAICLDTTP
jgi:hypothetical protein